MASAVFPPAVQPVPEFEPEDFDLPDTIQGWLDSDFEKEVCIFCLLRLSHGLRR